ncbi:hypothetical protein P170DRAFT_463890 [Aspergillus steynii IBT 23096]|uniref:Tat pathway signal sequence n=1 Tax=Aspergillus steynii IBT 23096 TaxID=1392250 RepID=A0A2I2GD34_9EURO|nr:uncharacterized protein P170DRAFT_463890 [Aspergillus steynii IBT 23096]PLB50785.1 hypothetical protein P170DRAFT_463890 [Aspergillus steynii IBT 23096]
MVGRQYRSADYADSDPELEVMQAMLPEEDEPIRARAWTRYLLSWLCGLFFGVLVVIPYSHVRFSKEVTANLPGALPRVPLHEWTIHHVQRNHGFEAAPPEGAKQEAIWDSLLPNGFGYVNHPDVAANLSILGVFHSLHCLYTIRRAYYDPNSTNDVLDLGLEREPHVGHCFDYLQQTLTCTVDPTIEPADKHLFEDPSWGFDKQCRDIEEIKAWAEEYRVWDAEGTFLPF